MRTFCAGKERALQRTLLQEFSDSLINGCAGCPPLTAKRIGLLHDGRPLLAPRRVGFVLGQASSGRLSGGCGSCPDSLAFSANRSRFGADGLNRQHLAHQRFQDFQQFFLCLQSIDLGVDLVDPCSCLDGSLLKCAISHL